MRNLILIGALILIVLSPQLAASQPVMHAETQSYMLCKSRHATHYNTECILVNASGARLTSQLFDSNDWQARDGILRTARRVPNTHDGEWIYGYVNAQGIELDLGVLHNENSAQAQLAQPPNGSGLPGSRRVPSMRDLAPFSDGLASVCFKGCGYIDTQGRWAIAPRADWAQANDFHYELALVRGPGYLTNPGPMSGIGPMHIRPPWSVIDKTGRIVMGYNPAAPNAYQDDQLKSYRVGKFAVPEINIHSDFEGGVAIFKNIVTKQGGSRWGMGMVDTKGRIVVPLSTKYDRDEQLRAAYFPAIKPKKDRPPDKKKWFRVGDTYQQVAKIPPFKWSPKKQYYANGVEMIDVQAHWKAERNYESKKLEIVTPFQNGFAVVTFYDPDVGKTEALMSQAGRIIVTYEQLDAAASPDKR